MRHILICVAMSVIGGICFGAISIDCNYPGGNIKVNGIDETNGVVSVCPDLRDTKSGWFHFDFTVRGAAGKKLQFRFPEGIPSFGGYLSPLGPAISSDGGATWRWLRNDGVYHESPNTFDYKFGESENATRFAFSIPHTQKEWDEYAARWRGRGAVLGTLCKSQSGKYDTEVVRIPCRKKAQWLFVFTARHHACETTGSYAMEGIIDEILSGSPEGEWIRDNADCVLVPFMDKDGVERGDQGKLRRPHDHNRDYTKGLYTSVRALKELAIRESKGLQIVFVDLHAPDARAKPSRKPRRKPRKLGSAFTIGNADKMELNVRCAEFRRNWIKTSKSGPLVYNGRHIGGAKKKKNATVNVSKTKKPSRPPRISRKWFERLPNCYLSICCEFSYATCGGIFSKDGGRKLGMSLMKALVHTVDDVK